MTKKWKQTLLSRILCMMLIVAMAFSTTACGDSNQEKPNTEGQTQSGGTEQDSGDGVIVEGESGEQILNAILGEGATVFDFVVVGKDGDETKFEIHTDETTVGAALLKLGLIAGEEQAYGLYVKTVNGVTVDYNKDGKYWAFYINDGYAMTGVDATPIQPGEVYSFRVE